MVEEEVYTIEDVHEYVCVSIEFLKYVPRQ